MHSTEAAALYAKITAAIKKNPALISTALQAIFDGSTDAINAANQRAQDHWVAMCMALTLTQPSRVTKKTREWANNLLVEKLKAGDTGTVFEAETIAQREGAPNP